MSAIFGWPLGWIMWLCYKIVPVYGVALLLFTVLSKAALVPVSIHQQKSMVKMQLFQPRIAEIQKKYANNREKMGEELNKLYQEEGYNPMMGCLPMLIQFPIILGLYDVIQKPLTHILRIPAETIAAARDIATGLGLTGANGADLARDVSAQIKIIGQVSATPEAFASLGDFVDKVTSLSLNIGPIDLTQMPQLNHLSILWVIPILSAATSLLLSIFTMRQNRATTSDNPAAAGMTRGMMLMMPLMSGYFGFILPAGVGVYWILSNLLMTIQSALLNKYMNPAEMAAKARAEYEAQREQARKEKIEAKKRARETGEEDERILSQKEANRLQLAKARKASEDKYKEETLTEDEIAALEAARRRMAEKYGDEYTTGDGYRLC